MKIFHTADWHIGKLVNGIHMTEDQAYVLDQLCECVRSEKPDAVLIAGDLYDRGVPPVQAIELLNKTLHTIVHDLKTPVIALAGNHDSNERIDFASGLLSGSGLHLAGMLKTDSAPVTLSDAHGPVHFHAIPYAEPAVVRELFADQSIKTPDDAMKTIVASIAARMNRSERNVAIAHGYVVKSGEEAQTCESERPLSMGGTESIDADVFEPFTYTALGHLHSPQKAGSSRVRYAGSLLKYSFSEVRQKKGITVVEIDGEGTVVTSFHEFKPLRDMRIIKGELKKIIEPDLFDCTSREDYIKAVLTDRGELLDPMAKLRSVYPNVLEMVREERLAAGAGGAASAIMKGRSSLELFESFYESMTGEACPPEYRAQMQTIIADAQKGDEA
jgi:exonuclease SbcD